MSKICFVGSGSTFKERDREMLEDLGYDVDQHSYDSGFFGYCREVKQAVKNADIVFVWFASWETLPAVYYAGRYDVPSVVVVGGYDAACCPDIDYGAWTNFRERWAARYIARHANVLLPVSRLTMRDLFRQVSPPGDVRLVYNGVDVERFVPSNIAKEDIAVCVSRINERKLVRKGLEVFVRSAALLPDIEFVLAGGHADDTGNYLQNISTDNVSFTGFVPDTELVELYQEASVVCQLSYYEAFGVSPLEGMACGCTPVVTGRRAGMPEFVGDAGFYTRFGDVGDAAQKIRLALDDDGLKARNRAEMFSLDHRKEGLKEVLEGLS